MARRWVPAPKLKCGRPTRSGKPCGQWRIADVYDPEGWRALSCPHHITEEEKRQWDAAIARAEASARAADDYEPACWSWPVWTPDDLAALKQEWASVGRSSRWSDEDWHGLMLSQWHAGRCALCNGQDDLVKDHDHETGLVRGYLCRSCNTHEGFRASGVWERYRQRNPAVMNGVRVRYLDPIWLKYAEPQPAIPDDPWQRSAMRNVGL